MSFGLRDPAPGDKELESVFHDINRIIENARDKIFFAAAANHGSHGPRAFPAVNPDVICIHASDGKGKDGGINPDPEDEDSNFMTLGMDVPVLGSNGEWAYKSGTSYATPFAAALAADMLYVTQYLIDIKPVARECIRRRKGMREILRLMCKPKGGKGYRFLAPWVQLWTENWHDDEEVIRRIESTINTNRVFRF